MKYALIYMNQLLLFQIKESTKAENQKKITDPTNTPIDKRVTRSMAKLIQKKPTNKMKKKVSIAAQTCRRSLCYSDEDD